MNGAKPAALCVSTLCACALAARSPPPRPLSDSEGMIFLELQPPAPELARFSFEADSVVALHTDGTEMPLEVPRIVPTGAPGERLLAAGRVPAGAYAGLAIKVARASD